MFRKLKSWIFVIAVLLLVGYIVKANEIDDDVVTQEMIDDSMKLYGVNIYEEAQVADQVEKMYQDFSMKEPEIKSGLKEAKANVKTNFVYAEGDMYRIYARSGFLTTIYFNPDESITYIAGGDTARWVIDEGVAGGKDGTRQIITLKPFFPAIKTNLVVSTNKRSYNFFLHSANDWYNPAVEFLYPQDIKDKIAKNKQSIVATTNVSVNDMNFGYKWNKKRYNWSPIQVYDDGKKTFVTFRQDISAREIPAIFIKDEQIGKEALVRNRFSGKDSNIFILDRLVDQIILKSGKKSITIKRNGSFIRNESDNYPIRR